MSDTVILGMIAGTEAAVRAASTRSAAEAKRLMAWRFLIVGKISSMSPSRCRRSASCGAIHSSAMTSPASWAAVWLAGAVATKNRVSYRRGEPSGVIQWAK